jgi:RNA polymerase sigma-70 factor (ECF subfamily)
MAGWWLGGVAGLPAKATSLPVRLLCESSILIDVDTASSKSGDLVLPMPAGQTLAAGANPAHPFFSHPPKLLQELWRTADAQACGLLPEEFGLILATVGEKLNHGLAQGSQPTGKQRADFLRSLHLPELALAQACALGREVAWERFLSLYRAPLTRAAIAITGSPTLGQEVADSVYAELFGLRSRDGRRASPLASYTGRGSHLSWLRATLAQRSIDHHRRSYREAPLDDFDAPASVPASVPAQPDRLAEALARTLQGLSAEDRYLLSAYFLDRQTLLEIGRILGVHEATISRRLKRLLAGLRKQLLSNLQFGGLSKRAAEEALGADPRDIEINLRALLQSSQTKPFFDQTARAASASDSI